MGRAAMDPERGVDPGSRTDAQILVRDLEEAIGIALDLERGRLYATDLGGNVYSAGLDGSDRTLVLNGQGAVTGIAVVQTTNARSR